MTQEEKLSKCYILDTNVILNDPECIYAFGANDIIIPLPVIEELDKFKKGNELINIHARTFMRKFEELTQGVVAKGELTVPLPQGGRLTTALGVKYPKQFTMSLWEDTQDHRILAICCHKQQRNAHIQYTLVSNDLNLQIKARSLGLYAESYHKDEINDIELVYRSLVEIKVSHAVLARIVKELEQNGQAAHTRVTKNFPPNTPILLKVNQQSQGLLVLTKKAGLEKQFDVQLSGLKARNAEQKALFNALMDPELAIIAVSGKAGTGKTLLALAAGLEMLGKAKYDQILTARPMKELSNDTMGYLPGGVDEKVDPYMAPIYDNLSILYKQKNKKSEEEQESSMKEWAKRQKIELLALNFIRGRSLPGKFIIIDEAQNTSPQEMKTIITRLGENAKIVVVGDTTQIDCPYLSERSNGLSHLINSWSGEPEFFHIHLCKSERSDLAEKAANLM